MKKPTWTLSLLALSLAAFGLQAKPEISVSSKDSHQDNLVLLVSENSLKLQQHPLLKDATVQKIIAQEQFTAKNGKKLEILAQIGRAHV